VGYPLRGFRGSPRILSASGGMCGCRLRAAFLWVAFGFLGKGLGVVLVVVPLAGVLGRGGGRVALPC